MNLKKFLRIFSLAPFFAILAHVSWAAERQVGPSNVSSSFGFYGTCPENLSGKLLCFVIYKKGVVPDSSRKEGELWVCTTQLTDYRKISDVSFSPHDGAEENWVDDNRIIFRDYEKSLNTSSLRVVDVRTGKDTLPPLIGATTLGHSPYGSHILFNVASKDGVISNRAPGIYEWDVDSGNVRPVFMQVDKANEILSKLPADLPKENLLPPNEWQCLHAQYSPDGQKIFFRIDVAKAEEGWIASVCDIQGKNLMMITSEPRHLLHALWLDSQTIVGHDREGKRWTEPGVLKLWKMGESSSTPVGLPGNHLAVSPDRKSFASETGYHSNPVVLRYFHYGATDITEGQIIAESKFPEVTWKKSFHMNPSFSRDGKRLYYNRALNGEINATFVSDIK